MEDNGTGPGNAGRRSSSDPPNPIEPLQTSTRPKHGQPSKPSANAKLVPPAPSDRQCAGQLENCAGLVPPVWDTGPLNPSGAWRRPSICAACRDSLERHDRDRQFEDAQIRARMPERCRAWSLDRVVRQRQREGWGDYRKRAAQYADHVGITTWNVQAAHTVREWSPAVGFSLFVYGPVGGGKTTLVAARANDLIRRGVDVCWLAESELLEAKRDERSSMTARALAAGVLVIDDLGVLEAIKPWQRDVMQDLIARRYAVARPVVISANLPIEDSDGHGVADQYGERVASRLVEMIGGNPDRPGYVRLIGYDWRTDEPHKRPSLIPTKPKRRRTKTPRHDWAKAAANDNDDD